ncbi:unnamed protein product [Effrenium voratum]|uniref:Uncharacterized protein n=1 Tax=Effrenium voratum TaxID=2562239 RepID=A0AA36MZS8_9DINO|nr:unnamed protein product [Effrenium voratum]
MSRSLVERSNSNRVPRGRSDVLKRLGTLSIEAPALTAAPSEEEPQLSQTQPLPTVAVEEPCGLTPASLKHLKRQRDALSEEKAKLQVELLDTAKQLKESRAFSRAGFACCCVVLFCFCFLFSFFLFLAGGETVRPTARGTVSPKGVGTLW